MCFHTWSYCALHTHSMIGLQRVSTSVLATLYVQTCAYLLAGTWCSCYSMPVLMYIIFVHNMYAVYFYFELCFHNGMHYNQFIRTCSVEMSVAERLNPIQPKASEGCRHFAWSADNTRQIFLLSPHGTNLITEIWCQPSVASRLIPTIQYTYPSSLGQSAMLCLCFCLWSGFSWRILCSLVSSAVLCPSRVLPIQSFAHPVLRPSSDINR